MILFVVPFGAMAFYRWHEMTPFNVAVTAIKRFREPKVKLYEHENEEYIAYHDSLKQKKEKKRKEKKNE